MESKVEKNPAKSNTLCDIVDIRSLNESNLDTTYRLQYLWPKPFDGFGFGRGGTALSTSGLDAAVLLVRHLYSFLPAELRDKNKADEEEKQMLEERERCCPILSYVWQNVPYPFSRETPSREQLTMVAQWQADALKSLAAAHDLWHDPSFIAIVHSPSFLEHLWCFPDYLLLKSPVIYQRLSDPGSLWGLLDVDPMRLAGRSLIVWDGQSSLGEAVTRTLGCHVSHDADIRLLLQWDNPAVFRVLYCPSAPDTPGYRDLRRVMIKVTDPVELDEQAGEPFIAGDACEIGYNLVASVRLRGVSGEEDLIRVYALDGRNIRPPFMEDLPVPYQSDGWKIGEQGHSYMLFFAKTTTIPLDETDEVFKLSQIRRSRMDMVSRYLDGVERRPSTKPSTGVAQTGASASGSTKRAAAQGPIEGRPPMKKPKLGSDSIHHGIHHGIHRGSGNQGQSTTNPRPMASSGQAFRERDDRHRWSGESGRGGRRGRRRQN